MTSARKWTPEEHDRFAQALCDNKLRSWSEIAAFVGTRTVRQCISHLQKAEQKARRRAEKVRKQGKMLSHHWTREECERLRQARCDSKKTWRAIAEAVGTRTERQCISHYQKCKSHSSMHLRDELKVLSGELDQWNQRAPRSATRAVHQAAEIGKRAYTDLETYASDDAHSVKFREESTVDVSIDALLADLNEVENTSASTEEPIIVLGMFPSSEEDLGDLIAVTSCTTNKLFRENSGIGEFVDDTRKAHQSTNEEAIHAGPSAPFDNTDNQPAFAGEFTTMDRLCAYIFNIDLVSNPPFADNENDTDDFSLLDLISMIDDCIDGSNYQSA